MRVGFIGAGGIAEKMAITLMGLESGSAVKKVMEQMGRSTENTQIPVIERTAIAARDRKRAEAFAKKYGFQKAYGSYEELLKDPDIELVYVALPHSFHCKWTKEALSAGKHVLCEKAFAMNAKEAAEMVNLAVEKQRFLAEAIWTRYMPSRALINQIIGRGEIGRVRTLSANLGYPVSGKERLCRPELGGGALLDLTVYPLNFASMVFGDDITEVNASCVRTELGVDGQNQVTLIYRDGKMADLFATMYTQTDRAGWIYGEKGILEVQNINNPEAVRLYRYGANHALTLEKEYSIQPQITGYEYEVVACALAIMEGKTECPEMPLSQTLEIMRQMDVVREKWKV